MIQKKIAARILKCSYKRVWLDPEKLDEIKEAMTKQDIRSKISSGLIQKKQATGISRSRAKKIHIQKTKGRKRGHGSRKGAINARFSKKRAWINKIRSQREFLRLLKEKSIVSVKDYRMLYMMAKGGFFRSIRHIKLYLDERGLVKKK